MRIYLLLFIFLTTLSFAQDVEEKEITKRLYEPLIERYILDELREIRVDHHRFRADVERRISRAEVYAYKADAVLDLDEYEWALSLSNKAIDIDKNYGYAFWQRSCANAMLGNVNDAISDLEMALEKSPNLKDEIEYETSFNEIKESEKFEKLVSKVKEI